MIETQTQQILDHLQSGKSITPIEALNEYGCFRLGARIYDLRKDGHSIEKDMVQTPKGTHVARYRMAAHGA
ncbi:MAG: hypothetical protein HRU30_10435 [Rhodobacteraceae bacterium]|nr:hypothetical protein [Paracoccaceae bacterium]